MPTGATMYSPSGPSGTAGGTAQTQQGQSPAPAAVVPFIRASQLHREQAAIDVIKAMTTSDQDLGVFPVPAYGYLRNIVLLVTATGGTGTTVTLAADGPFSAIKNIALQEPNGATLSQFNSGYDLFLANKYGGYVYYNDPRSSPVYSTAIGSNANFSFLLRIPVEINVRDALGSLPNQNAAAAFNVRLTLSAVAAVFGGTVSVPPSVRVRAWAEEWDQPEPASEGATNQTTPPAMNTTQYWSTQQYPVNSGTANIRLTRMGNYIRNLIFVYRDGSSVRLADSQWPTPATLYWDTRPLDQIEINNWNQQMYERYGYGGVLGATVPALDSPQGLDTGVKAYDFCHEFDGGVGKENRDLWLPTLGSTRFEIGGTNWGTTGTLYVLTNDVSVAGNVFL